MRRALVLAIGVVLAAAAPATAAAPPAAQVWVTTPDGAMKMSDRGNVRFRPGGSGALTISVDPSRRYQRMEGFGASLTDSSAHLLARLDRRTRTATMRSLFRTNRLSFLRQPMGSSDFVAGDHYTYTLPGGALATFTWPASRALDDGRVLLPISATDEAANAADDDATTRWTTGAAQAPGQSLQVDLGRVQRVRRVVLDTAPTPATSRAATPCSPAPTGRTGASAPRAPATGS